MRRTSYELSAKYLGRGAFEDKLISHVHNQIMHLGVSNTMATLRGTWWIPKLREKMKKSSTNVTFANYIRQNRLKSQSQRKCQVLERKVTDHLK
jgi:hypothetical protein